MGNFGFLIGLDTSLTLQLLLLERVDIRKDFQLFSDNSNQSTGLISSTS